MPEAKSDTRNEPGRDSSESPVLFVSPASGGMLAANVIAGVIVCAIVGSCLGLAVNQLWIGAVVGVLIALSGFRFARRKDELSVLQIERGTNPGTMFIELRRGKSLTWSAADVSWIETKPEGDDDAAKTHWVVLHRVGTTPVRFRAKDGDQAAGIVLTLRDLLGLKEPPPEVVKAEAEAAAKKREADAAKSPSAVDAAAKSAGAKTDTARPESAKTPGAKSDAPATDEKSDAPTADAKSEPATSEGAKSEPATSEGAKSEPATFEGAKSEPANATPDAAPGDPARKESDATRADTTSERSEP